MPQKECTKAQKVMPFVIVGCMFLLQIGLASAANATYDQILQPIQAIYDLVKYAVTIIAGIVLTFAGITYITSGSDPGKRDKAKNMIMYVLIGLAVIWAAPLL